MSQSSFILGALLAGFVLFIAARGRLPTYAAVFWGAAPATPGGSSSSSGGSPLGIPGLPGVGDALSLGANIGHDLGAGGIASALSIFGL